MGKKISIITVNQSLVVLLLVIHSFLLNGCLQAQTKLVSFNSAALQYQGRVVYLPEAAILSWSGSSVGIRFYGTGISAILRDTDTSDYYNVILDNNVVNKLHVLPEKKSYELAAGLKKSWHSVLLFKRTEWAMGKTFFYGFEASEQTIIAPSFHLPKRKIEFFGNSITCGYGVEDSSGLDSGAGYFENNYLSYAAITARHFGAQYSCISKSGIGVMVSWFPLIMPEMYERADATDSLSKWYFVAYQPDIVVVNLFQNDSWIVEMPDDPAFKYRFGKNRPDEAFIINAYGQFIQQLRKHYPKANIICALGNMDATRAGSLWPGYIEKAIARIKDPQIFTCFFPFKNTKGHPNPKEQNEMANQLIDFINKHISW